MCLIMTEDGWRNLGDGKVCSNHNDLQGVFRAVPLEQVRITTAMHAKAFARVLETGSMREIKDFNYGLKGAFGEKL